MQRYLFKLIIPIFVFAIILSFTILADIYDVSTLNYVEEITYEDYLNKYKNSPEPDLEIIIPAAVYTKTDMNIEIKEDFEGYPGKVIITEEDGFVEWEVEVEKAGFYNLALDYYPIKGKGTNISRSLEINGETPFESVKFIDLYRIWRNAEDIRVDNRGNEIAPRQEEIPAWITIDIRDSVGYYNEPYKFYFKEGINTIRLISDKEPVMLGNIKLYQTRKIPSYQEKLNVYLEKGYRKTEGFIHKIQAEKMVAKSNSSILPVSDLSDPTLEPYHHAEIRLNTIGGISWQKSGEWIEWEFEVPEDGLYKIGFKVKQNLMRGNFVTRKLYIDGEIPFKEAEKLEFHFSSRYQMMVPENKATGEPYYFYLKKGKHRLRLEVSIGDMAPILRETEACLYELNKIYRQIIMITSAAPDTTRDYQLEKRIPAVIEELGRQAEILSNVEKSLVETTGEVGLQAARIREIARNFREMAEKPKTIKKRIKAFRDNLANLGTWIIDSRNQPLTLDYIIIASPEEEMPEVQAGFFKVALHEIKKYIASYYVDYEMIGDVYDKGDTGQEPLRVWIIAGRDQAQILKRMIEDSFTPDTGIFVNLELVSLGMLLPATLADKGPDVALGVEASGPIDFALRNAVVDLTQFDDFPEVKERFHKSAFVPFTFRDSVYALPQQQVFPVLFYRKDILYDLGLGIPETWDDVLQIIPELQKKNMNFGLPINDLERRRTMAGSAIGTAAGAGSISAFPGIAPFLTFLYQRGEDLYYPDGVKTRLDTEGAVEAFRLWTDLYELYKLPIYYDAANRFRTGEVPLLYENYPFYNFLQVFAPELRGKWGFTLIPGTRREDGSIDRTIPNGVMAYMSGSADMILENAKDKEAAWEFLKWWSSTEVQARYGLELEALMGESARYPTANVEACELLPWKSEELKILKDQWQYIKGIPEVPGGYMTGRHLDNAFRKVFNEKEDPREVLLDYVRVIDEELTIKRQEFGLETDFDAVLRKYEENRELYNWWD
jgi:ABC-type glycerol-3-phosphate transport system substrate-binding protein